MDLQNMGKMLLLLGATMAIAGGLLILLGRMPFPGTLPGDIRLQDRNWGCYVPLAASILLSIILTLVLNVSRDGSASDFDTVEGRSRTAGAGFETAGHRPAADGLVERNDAQSGSRPRG